MIKIENEFTVKAQASEIWEVITQVDRYSDWNSFVSKCETTLKVGEPIKMKVHLLAFPILQKETILEHQPGKMFNYGIKLPLNILKSSRKHIVEQIDEEHASYRSVFCLEGLLSPLVAILMESRLIDGFSRMSQELQAEVLRRQR